MGVPEISDVQNGIRYDTRTALLLATDESGEAKAKLQTTYLLRGQDGRYFAACLTPWRGDSDYISPLSVEAAQKLYNTLPLKVTEFDAVIAEHIGQIGNVENTPKTIRSVSATLTSGDTIVIKSIMLYPAEKLQLAQTMIMDAKTKLGGVSTGIGFLGSPGWVIGGAILTGFVEQVASRVKASEGVGILERAENLLQQIRSQGRWFPVYRVSNIDLPAPNLWLVDQQIEDMRVQGIFSNKTVPRNRRFIHNGEPYFRATAEGGAEWCVMCGKVERWSGHFFQSKAGKQADSSEKDT